MFLFEFVPEVSIIKQNKQEAFTEIVPPLLLTPRLISIIVMPRPNTGQQKFLILKNTRALPL